MFVSVKISYNQRLSYIKEQNPENMQHYQVTVSQTPYLYVNSSRDSTGGVQESQAFYKFNFKKVEAGDNVLSTGEIKTYKNRVTRIEIDYMEIHTDDFWGYVPVTDVVPGE